MRVLLDNCVDIRFREHIRGHDVVHTLDMGWGALSNGVLLAAAENAAFEVFVTVDKNLRHQQNFAKRTIRLVVLNPRMVTLEYLAPLAPSLQSVLDRGEFSDAILVLDS
ncbi:MAG TPA: hypothetical protein VGK19_06960 [Capsulimonadaceae bacterium]|jgi:hypothetical protein